jgi:hypothetical protein
MVLIQGEFGKTIEIYIRDEHVSFPMRIMFLISVLDGQIGNLAEPEPHHIGGARAVTQPGSRLNICVHNKQLF